MNQTSARTHPLLLGAAIAVLLLCVLGIGAILGWIPSPLNHGAAPVAPVAQVAPPYGAADSNSFANAAGVPALPPPSQAVQEGRGAPDGRVAPAPRVAQERAPVHRSTTHERVAGWCGNCGNIESVRAVTTRAPGSGVGAAGGAVLGGLLGHQIGGGNGRNLATVAGAVGGAVLGNHVEGNMHAATTWEIRVRLDDGSEHLFHQNTEPRWHDGERVKIVDGALRAL